MILLFSRRITFKIDERGVEGDFIKKTIFLKITFLFLLT